MSDFLLIKNGTCLIGEEAEVQNCDILIGDGQVLEIGDSLSFPTFKMSSGQAVSTINATGMLVCPGFIQTHVHLCQTLFRGSADDLELLDWLRKRIWPLEAAHTPQSLTISALLAVAEMIKGGTTAALTMETVNHTEAVFEAVQRTGFRAFIGKCMMDVGDGVPEALKERTKESLDESLRLMKRWNNRESLVQFCFAPRFAVSCSHELLQEVARLALENSVLVHTHASENLREVELVLNRTGMRNVDYLHSVGLTGNHVALAHCVHLSEEEKQLLAATKTHVLHCPSSNLKLASGIAPVCDLLKRGVNVSLGADGAPCNNRLDIFTEMRLAALLQKVSNGSEALPAKVAFKMATIAGARTLGMEKQLGSIEVGKKADLVLIKLNKPHTTPASDVISTLVYSATASDVDTVIVNGRVLMQGRQLFSIDEEKVVNLAKSEFKQLCARVGL
ncbi:MAG: 5'-deoxyadenosine deaminase [Acidobacteriota bacterium]|nr:5'-deoxyadenosine deaminase [Blastocatellia bacterium]MDW8411691.1 5'-deoxyadenosine deaminase [Acidobacteriota bacterium]